MIAPTAGRPARHRRRATRLAAGAVLLVAGLLLAGCGGDDGGSATLVSGETAEVLALDNTFRPETVTVQAGTTVHWVNRGRNDHDVVPVDDGAGFRADVADFHPGDEYSFRFTEPGTYRYYCTIHGTPTAGMIGTVEVVAP